MAQIVRLLIILAFMGLAAWTWHALGPGALRWALPPVIFLSGGTIGDRLFRHLASPEEIRADLEDRLRNTL